jgi:hypothetical protein
MQLLVLLGPQAGYFAKSKLVTRLNLSLSLCRSAPSQARSRNIMAIATKSVFFITTSLDHDWPEVLDEQVPNSSDDFFSFLLRSH